jgi:hypothetical protein
MNPTRVARTALALVFSVSMVTGCGSEAGEKPPSALPSSEAVKKPAGYAIHDVWTPKGGAVSQKMDGVSCSSPHGPWHITISADNAAAGLSSFNAFYDITMDPSTGKGTLTGEEHSVTTDGQNYDGKSTGTAAITPEGAGYLIKLEIDFDVLWRNPKNPPPPGQERIKGHSSRELHVIGATGQECP